MNEDIKRVDIILTSWGRWVKAGHSLAGLGYPTMTSVAKLITPTGSKPDVKIMEEVDIAVGRLNEPFQAIVRRRYLDPRSRGGYYSERRTIDEQARSQRMTKNEFNAGLRIARHRLAGKLEEIL